MAVAAKNTPTTNNVIYWIKSTIIVLYSVSTSWHDAGQYQSALAAELASNTTHPYHSGTVCLSKFPMHCHVSVQRHQKAAKQDSAQLNKQRSTGGVLDPNTAPLIAVIRKWLQHRHEAAVSKLVMPYSCLVI